PLIVHEVLANRQSVRGIADRVNLFRHHAAIEGNGPVVAESEGMQDAVELPLLLLIPGLRLVLVTPRAAYPAGFVAAGLPPVTERLVVAKDAVDERRVSVREPLGVPCVRLNDQRVTALRRR